MSEDNKINALLKEFLLEAFEEVSSITEALPKLESDPGNEELINKIYRSMHTIKGACSFLQFTKVEQFTHHIENLLSALRSGDQKVTPDVVDVLLQATDVLGAGLNGIELSGNDAGFEPGGVEGKIQGLTQPKVHEAQVSAEPLVESQLEEESKVSEATKQEEASIVEMPQAVEPNQESLDLAKVAEEELSQVLEEPAAPAPKPPATPKSQKNVEQAVSAHNESSVSDSVIKVHVNLLDKMMNVVGELVLNRNQILQHSGVSESAELIRLANELNAITSELQTDIMATRMQPIGSVLVKFERLVRDLSRATGKKVQLRLEGQDTELDRTIIEAIKDPLTHLVRNSMDHGIETPDVRLGKGKDENGTLLVKAYHEGGQVTIEIRDDGNGLARERIVEKALEKGLVTEEKVQEMSDSQVNQLIFMPGFSTAAKVTNISGRGVGMDVVKTNIEKIGGQVDVSSRVGEGTTFKLKIPLTLAIIPALIVRANGEPFAIPQINLVELVRLDESNVDSVEKVGESEFLRLRGKLLPVLRLNSVLEYNTEKASEELNVVILNAEGMVFGLVVDSIQDTQEIVVKPLGSHLKELDVYAGATIMGDGDVALILDALGLVKDYQAQADNASMESHHDLGESVQGFREGQEMILFSLSSEATFGVPLALVNRLEEFKSENIEQVGQMPVMQYRDSVMPLIDLNVELGLKAEAEFKDNFSVLVVKSRSKYFGLAVDQVLDIVSGERAEFETNNQNQMGVIGSTFVDGKTITVLDIYSILEKDQPTNSAVETVGKGKTALVVDDSPFFRKLEEDALRLLGFQVLTAKNGKEALEQLTANHVDIVVSDIEMPVMNGYEFAKEVRSMDGFSELPMVAITTRNDEASIQKGNDAGFSAFLEKFNKEEVIETVCQFVRDKAS